MDTEFSKYLGKRLPFSSDPKYQGFKKYVLQSVERGEKIMDSIVPHLSLENKKKIAVINLLGRVFMKPVDCPFTAAEREIGKINRETKIILVDMHAEATSEKIAMGRFLDGRVSAVFGTHTHVQTADEKIFPHGTGYITDLGMTGPQDSVIGRRHDAIVEHFLTLMPKKFEVADKDVELQGAIVNIDDESGKCLSIERVREKL